MLTATQFLLYLHLLERKRFILVLYEQTTYLSLEQKNIKFTMFEYSMMVRIFASKTKNLDGKAKWMMRRCIIYTHSDTLVMRSQGKRDECDM